MTALVRIFVDTNVLIYARDDREADKRRRAEHWLTEVGSRSVGRTNLQVLNEFTRWMLAQDRKRPVEDVRREIDVLSSWGDKPTDRDEVEIAWAIRAATGYQWFDCLLLAAADTAGCSHFLSEDMTDGRLVGALRIVDPFRTKPSEILQQN